MAHAIERAINQRTHLVAEAGTGTGKTFAYLIPAILSGKKTIISTGTRNLQDQIFEKDFHVHAIVGHPIAFPVFFVGPLYSFFSSSSRT